MAGNSILNLSCTAKSKKDVGEIVIINDNVTIRKNKLEEGKMSIKNIAWESNNIINYQITLPKNSTATFDPEAMTSANTNVKVIFITSENSIVTEKKYENDKLYFKQGTANSLPLGKLTVFSGTHKNRIDGPFVFYNGTPNSNVANINDGQYNATIDIVAGF